MEKVIPFRRVAIFDPWLILERDQNAPHHDLEDKVAAWVKSSLSKGADGFYLRLRGMPPPLGKRVVEETLHRAPKDLHRIILPFGWEEECPEVTAIQFSEHTIIPYDFPEGLLRGCSCHTAEAVKSAIEEGYDYVFFSPVFSTLTHIDRTPTGTAHLAEICANSPVPVFALGGVNEHNEQECLQAGAYGIAAIRMFLS